MNQDVIFQDSVHYLVKDKKVLSNNITEELGSCKNLTIINFPENHVKGNLNFNETPYLESIKHRKSLLMQYWGLMKETKIFFFQNYNTSFTCKESSLDKWQPQTWREKIISGHRVYKNIKVFAVKQSCCNLSFLLVRKWTVLISPLLSSCGP